MTQHKEFIQIFKKGAEFTEELLRENERLRFKLMEAERQLAKPEPTGDAQQQRLVDELLTRIKQLEAEKEGILSRIQEVEEENKDFANRYIEIEEENNNLANLYVASYQLHSTLDFDEVLQIITEIVINLIGAEEFAVYLADDKSTRLSCVASEGPDKDGLPAIHFGEGAVGKVAESGENFYEAERMGEENVEYEKPLVAIPLKIKQAVIGVISIFKFLQQKETLHSVDYELFTLLAGHAATAIFSSKLYSESERKLHTIQNFIDLMTS